MKPAPFAYHPVRTVDQVVAALARWGPEGGRILAGGQSLLPMMALRLAQPAHLIDINRVAGLDRIEVANGELRIGACVRHSAFEQAVVPGALGTLLAQVAAHIAHLPIRTRGTLCGSLAHADPASEWCLVAVALDAVLVARSVAGERRLPAAAFFQAAMTTALRDDEMLAELRVPLPPRGTRFGFCEHSRRAGDYAQAMALVSVRRADGGLREARVAVGGAEDRPRRLPAVEAILVAEGADAAAAAAEAAAEAIDPMVDGQVSAGLRRDLVRATVRRAALQALAA